MKQTETEKLRQLLKESDDLIAKLHEERNLQAGRIAMLENELKQAKESWAYFETQNRLHVAGEEYYREQLAKSHELLGRVIHQASERWDSVNLTKFYPTDNLGHQRSINNPSGENIDHH